MSVRRPDSELKEQPARYWTPGPLHSQEIMDNSNLVGYAAATLTTCSFIPQVWLTFKTRDVRGISLGMYSVFTLGIALWLVYGLLQSAWPVVVANAITLALALAILIMKLRFGAGPSAGLPEATDPRL